MGTAMAHIPHASAVVGRLRSAPTLLDGRGDGRFVVLSRPDETATSRISPHQSLACNGVAMQGGIGASRTRLLSHEALAGLGQAARVPAPGVVGM